jgi:uncharacterized damage-inducible protein DinB
MTYYGGKELATSFRTVRSNTIRIAEEIPEERYAAEIAPGCRTIAETLAHIAINPDVQMHIHQQGITDITQVNFPQLMQSLGAIERQPRSKAELIALLKTEGEKFATYVEALAESTLGETVAMFPGATPAHKSRFEMLLSPKEHEMHHRGQLMAAQRAAGLTPHLTRERQARAAQAPAPATV